MNRGLETFSSRRVSFLLLPLEVRDIVYCLLRQPRTFQSTSKVRLGPRSDILSFSLPPTLLRVCRQIHDEASSYLYSYASWRLMLGTHIPPCFPAATIPTYSHMVSRYEIRIYMSSITLWKDNEHDMQLLCQQLMAGPRIKKLEVHYTLEYKSGWENYPWTGGTAFFPPLRNHEILKHLGILSEHVDEIVVGQVLEQRVRGRGSLPQAPRYHVRTGTMVVSLPAISMQRLVYEALLRLMRCLFPMIELRAVLRCAIRSTLDGWG